MAMTTQGSQLPPWSWVAEPAEATCVGVVVCGVVVAVVEGACVPAGEVGAVALVRGAVVPGGAVTLGPLGAAVGVVVGPPAGDVLTGGALGDAKNSAVTEIPLSAWLATTRWPPAGVTGTSN
jgi:hypothetical protein